MGKVRVIVGLGNPGRAYARHRHNIGFMVVDALAERAGGKWISNKERTLICETTIEGEKALLVKPQTFMNLSGKAVGPIIQRLDFDAPKRMIVVHDDLDISEGRAKIKVGGGDGGHKGIRSIADSLRFRDFIRVRLGIGRPPSGMTAEEYVLASFEGDADRVVEGLVDIGCDAVTMIVSQGIEKAQMAFHPHKEATKNPAAAG
jgi:peptidyl-tRNA hydrolase, PTH1 family